MKVKWQLLIPIIIIVAILLIKPTTAQPTNITLIQFNDVYEITPVSGGKAGGLARVATLRKQLLQQNPNTYTILAGDFFSPSALGTAMVDGEPLAGKQMIAVLNALGLDYATFGNHEFDLKEKQFIDRLKESKFKWFSSNVFDAAGKPLAGIPATEIITIKTSDKPIKIGLIGVTIDSNPTNYVSYTDAIEATKEQVKTLKGKVDIIVAVTHLNLAQDQKLAEAVPEIDVILGGHEHENIQQWRADDLTPLFKADANVRTVYIHNLRYDPAQKKLEVNSRIQPITTKIAEDPDTNKVVVEWVEKGFAAFRAGGFNPEELVTNIAMPLDGLSASVRNKPTFLTQLIAKSMLREVKNADLAIFNGGSIRIDDVIPAGPVTQYDVIRVLPFGGKVVGVELEGSLLKRVLEQGLANKGSGGYLHSANVSRISDGSGWLIGGNLLEENKHYRVAIIDFLLTGKETGLDFLTAQQVGVKVFGEGRDVRFCLIDELRLI